MYNYAFKGNGEQVLSEAADVIIRFSCKNILVNILLTNKNILVFYDSDRSNILKSRGIQIMPQYEILFKVDLSNMDYKIVNDDTILNINNNSIIFYNFNITDFIEKDG